jgi:acyl-coenzyme A synthetase/AMP-(fatty) acid ligase
MKGGMASDPVAVPLANTEDIAVIGVSSGTSGTPNPVALSHECLYARAAIARTSPQWSAGGRFLVTAPLAFSATRKHVISRLLDGGCVIFTPLLINAAELAETIRSAGVTSMLTVPAIARELMALADTDETMFPGLDYLMCCGAPMTPEEKMTAARRLSSGFVQNYGTTMAGMVTVLETADIAGNAQSVGRPLPHVLTQIVDADNRPLPAGETGTIRVRTPGVGRVLNPEGFDGKPRDSDLLIDGWIYPGDLGFLDEAGFLTIVGRSSDVIIRGGVNVYPREIELVLADHPAVREAAVVGWPDPILGEEIAAFVVPEKEVRTAELLAFCRSRLHPDKQPREIFAIEAMPTNPNGKLVRRELVARLPERKT